MVSLTIVYGFLAVATGGRDYERLLTCIMYVNTIAIVVFNLNYLWTLSLMICAVGNFFGFEIFNPAVNYQEAIGTTIFYAMGIFAATIARKTQSILAQKTFLMSLRDQYRSAKLKDANRQLEILATCDPLTGLANRRSAEQLIEKLWSDRRIAKAAIAFVMADIDWFKLLNDTAGHAAGDECIKSVAHAIEMAVRSEDDAVCRYGGEEFLIVLSNTTPDLAWTLAERIRSAVEALGIVNPGIHRADGSSAVITISLGVAFAREGAAAQLVAKWADDALYDAKRSGRNVVFMATDKGAEAAPFVRSPEALQPRLGNPPTKVA
jgi:diguanylate cyclase (GGDEF)-like protein